MQWAEITHDHWPILGESACLACLADQKAARLYGFV